MSVEEYRQGSVLGQARRLDAGRVGTFVARSLTGFAVLLAAGVAFALLLVLVRTGWAPLRGLDFAVAHRLNAIVAARPVALSALRVVTDLGGSAVNWLIVSTAVAWLLVRRQPRLAVLVLVTGLGAAILGPSIKELVGRARPLVPTPVATAPGNSFPSGHALGSMVSYGMVLLVFLPAVPRRARVAIALAAAGVVAAVGVTRVALGVHYVSDVVGGWLLGGVWLAVTTTAFRQWRRVAGLPGAPLTEGVAPEAAPALALAPRSRRERLPDAGPAAARLLVLWVLLLGVLVATGLLFTEVAAGTAMERLDVAPVRVFADLRSPGLDAVSAAAGALGGTPVIAGLALVVIPLTLAVTRRWRPALFLGVTMLGELTLFLAARAIVDRPPVPVGPLHPAIPPTGSFPSGYVAAAICWYGALALLVASGRRANLRWLLLVLAGTVAALTSWAGIHRGQHVPTDALAGVLLAVPWLAATWHLLGSPASARGSPTG